MPRYNTDQSDFVHDVLLYMREHNYDIAEATPEAVQSWTTMLDSHASMPMFRPDIDYFYRSEIPGKVASPPAEPARASFPVRSD